MSRQITNFAPANKWTLIKVLLFVLLGFAIVREVDEVWRESKTARIKAYRDGYMDALTDIGPLPDKKKDVHGEPKGND